MRALIPLALLALFAAAAPALASSLPDQGKLRFDVIRKGKDIGDHSYVFSGSPAHYSVQVATRIAVKVPLIQLNAYVFEQQSTETWAGGKMTAIASDTNDNGTPHQLSQPGQGLLPASLWNDDIVHSRKLLNTIDGKVMSVRVTDLGMQAVPSGKGEVNAHHFRISGDLERDVWYDDAGNLAHVSFKADDGSTVTYVRK
ncbi:DUF6134 family protein [Ruegeria sp. PrR005]|uniref:DUF3108 domain-containing protein n=1 Tax=Ruegeria sp. PrR005 TaxID=2706882 RepID=A0A6B2NTN2_9RHOB|nr:hypothetical protein [Ruegeria sp. PrR005]